MHSPVTIPASESEPETEVADSSLAEDPGQKLTTYAAAKFAEYGIMNLVDRQIEVYTAARGRKNPACRARTARGPEDSVPVAVAGRAVGSIAVRDVLP